MGNTLSPMMANLYMELFETNLVSHISTYSYIKFWFRSVNDVLAIVPHNFSLQCFSLQLYQLTPLFKFTIETHNNNCIAFLDILIIQNQDELKFKVYRKPTSCNQLLHALSDHPRQL